MNCVALCCVLLCSDEISTHWKNCKKKTLKQGQRAGFPVSHSECAQSQHLIFRNLILFCCVSARESTSVQPVECLFTEFQCSRMLDTENWNTNTCTYTYTQREREKENRMSQQQRQQQHWICCKHITQMTNIAHRKYFEYFKYSEYGTVYWHMCIHLRHS